MAPSAVSCSLCGGKFFKASLAHHQKVCQERIGKQCHECSYCHSLVPLLEMDAHIRTCEVARAAGAKPTGASSALARRLQKHSKRLVAVAAGIPEITEDNHLVDHEKWDMPEFGDHGDSRIPCQCCGRRFAIDRIGKHQAVCQKALTKKRPKVRLFHAVGPGRGAAPVTSNWRKRSEDLRQACLAGRGVVEADQVVGHQAAWTPQVAAGHSLGQKTSGSCNPATILIQDKFDSLDVDNDGALSREEMDSFLKSLDPCASSAKLDVAFRNIDKDSNGLVDVKEFCDCILDGMATSKKPAAGSALAHIRRRAAQEADTCQKRAAETPQLLKPDEFRRRPRSASLSSPAHPGAKTRRRSAGAARPAEPLPAWGSAESCSRYGMRVCITPADADTWKFGRCVVNRAHNTPLGGCSAAHVMENEGMKGSNRCSPGRPFDRSWLYEKSKLQPSCSPSPPPQAPILLGRTSRSQPCPSPSMAFTPTKPAFQASALASSYHPRRRNIRTLHVHFE